MDSRKIADYIESQSPVPSVHLDSPYLPKVESLWTQYVRAFTPIFVPRVPKVLLSEISQKYFYRTREETFGMTLDQLEKAQGGDKAWDNVQLVLAQVTELLKENEGTFFMGSTPSYADLVWGSMLLFHECLGQDVLEEALKRSGDARAHLDLLEAIRQWV